MGADSTVTLAKAKAVMTSPALQNENGEKATAD